MVGLFLLRNILAVGDILWAYLIICPVHLELNNLIFNLINLFHLFNYLALGFRIK